VNDGIPHDGEQASTPDVKGKNDTRLLVHRQDLEGHVGAVYAVAFSRKGPHSPHLLPLPLLGS